LNGTDTVGIEGFDAEEWAVDFGLAGHFLFASGDFKNWVFTDRAFLNKINGTPMPYSSGSSNGMENFNIFKSSLSETSASHEFKFTSGEARTPTFGADALVLTSWENKSLLYF